MNYREFIDYIKENLAEYVVSAKVTECKDAKEEYEVNVNKIIKNNGVELDGISIRRNGEKISPNLYLEGYYKSYQMGKPISSIMEDLADQYCKARKQKMFEVNDIMRFDAVQDKIVLRLVNYERNKEQLTNCPHKKYLDLAVTFRYAVEVNEDGVASSLLSNSEFENWGISQEVLYQVALRNTMKLFPHHIDYLSNTILNCIEKGSSVIPEELMKEMKELENMKGTIVMFVLTNQICINGATCMLYDGVIRDFANSQDANVFLLPSSLHEMMLVPDTEGVDADFLQQMVVEANRTAVGLIDYLSDSIYYYDREKDEIAIYDNANVA